MSKNKLVVRVRAKRSMIVMDDGCTVHMVPEGMHGNLVGCQGMQGKQSVDDTKKNMCLVEWDAHAVGDSYTNNDEPDESYPPSVVVPGFNTLISPNDIECVGGVPI